MTREGRCRAAPPFPFASGAVVQAADARLRGAVRAAEEGAGVLAAVADDAAAAVRAGRRQRVDGAFEAVEGVGAIAHHHLEGLVVIVAAGVAAGHGGILVMTLAGSLGPGVSMGWEVELRHPRAWPGCRTNHWPPSVQPIPRFFAP